MWGGRGRRVKTGVGWERVETGVGWEGEEGEDRCGVGEGER